MKHSTKDMKAKIEDYRRFVITLLILSIYFYLGMVITVYIEEQSGNSNLLIGLMLVCIVVAGWFSLLLRNWVKKLNDIQE
jgi:hypothetical protein